MRLFVWDNFAPDWSSGLAFAIAESEEQARELVIKDLGFCVSDWGPVKIFDLTQSVGFGVYGGS